MKSHEVANPPSASARASGCRAVAEAMVAARARPARRVRATARRSTADRCRRRATRRSRAASQSVGLASSVTSSGPSAPNRARTAATTSAQALRTPQRRRAAAEVDRHQLVALEPVRTSRQLAQDRAQIRVVLRRSRPRPRNRSTGTPCGTTGSGRRRLARCRAIYLDNAASTRVSDEVLALVTEVMRTAWGNPSSQHPQGAAARGHLETARRRLLAALGDPRHAATWCGRAAARSPTRSPCSAPRTPIRA